jgi:class 3 adenylate cyclase/tetratricopeptide (TPR) repeat protein
MAQSGTATLLFTDLVNSTAQLQQAGDEMGAHLFQAHHKLMTDAITAAGGEELQWLGDGLLAAFSSTADAVRCATGIQQTARRPNARTRFEIRIGIHFGEMLRGDGGYFGLPVVTARRLCDRASPGQILCSNMIPQLLASRQNFEFRDRGDLLLKDLPTPVGVCEVVYQPNDPAAMLHRTPFVGRNPQLERLSAKLGEALNGRGSVAMLRGEAGIGKTRILEEFAELAVQSGAVVLRGACYDGEWQRPIGPFAEAIGDYARHVDLATLAADLGNTASILSRISPALSESLGEIAEPTPLGKDEERLRLFDAVAQFLVAVSQRTPLVLILDDLHWAERSVIAMLSHVAHFVPANPIFLIGAYRDAEVDRKHPLAAALAGISRLRNFETLTLEGLRGDELADLLEMIGDQDAPDELVKALAEATNGNPLFIREVLLHLLEEGKILREGQGWMAKLSIADLGIPEGVRQVISSRLLRLSEDANQLLKVASAFNGAFSLYVAASAAGLDEDAALGAIDEALEAQLLRPGVNSEIFDFTHAIIRHTLYSELSSVRRVRLHRKIAEEMERAWGERATEHAAEVAYQFWRGAAASDTSRGVSYAIAAANNAEAACAHDEAAAFLRIALELLGSEDPRRPRLLGRWALSLTWTLNAEEALKVAREAGGLIEATEGALAATDYYDQTARTMLYAGIIPGAWALAQEGLRLIGDRRDITWASLTEIDISRKEAEDPNNPGIRIDSPDSRELYAALKLLPREQLRTRNFDPPFESRDEVNQDPAPPHTALFMLAGDYRRSLPLQQQEAADNEKSGAIARAIRAWADVARCHNALGEFIEGRAALDRAAALSARMTSPTLALLTLVAARGELLYAIDEGWEQLMSDAAAGAFIRDPGPEGKWASAMINAYVSYLFAQINQPALAMQRVSLLPAALERGAPWARTYCATACIAAATVWTLNRTDHAEAVERSIREKVLGPDFRSPMSDGRLSLARLCALQGRYDEASDWFVKARVVLDEQGARPLRAIADYDEALMYLRRAEPGDTEHACPLLTVALEQFNALGMRGWIRAAEEGLAKEPL